MQRFRYKAKNLEGKTVTGIVESRDEKSAVVILKEKGLIPISLKPQRDSIDKLISQKIFNRISLNDIATFTRQLSTMNTAGLTINEALRILRNQSSAAMGKIIDDVLRSVEGGSSFAVALEKHPEVFTKVYIALVKAGEAAGVLDNVLARLADNLEKQREFQGKVKGAMIYPVIVIAGMFAVGILMMIFVIPKLLDMYKDFEAEIPFSTRVLIIISDSMVNFWWLGLIGLGVGFYLFLKFKKTPFGAQKVEELLFKIPIIGKLQIEIILTEMSRTLGLLVGAGISIVEALNITSEAVGSTIYGEIIADSAKQVEKGLSLAAVMASYDRFPQIVTQMVSVGEETGKMDEVLVKLSKYFEAESDEMVKGLTTAIEPIMMIILGVGVVFLIIAIIMPIYGLTSQF